MRIKPTKHWWHISAAHQRLDSDTVKSRLSVGRDLIFILAILVFFDGWLFVYFFLDQFGISLFSLSLPFYHFYFYALNVGSYMIANVSFLWWFVVLLLTGTLFFLFSYRPVLILTILVISWSVMGFHFTWLAALTAEQRLRSGKWTTIEFEFQERAVSNRQVGLFGVHAGTTLSSERDKLYRANANGRLFLIAQSTTAYIVFYNVPTPEGVDEPPRGFVYHIPVDEVEFATARPTQRKEWP